MGSGLESCLGGEQDHFCNRRTKLRTSPVNCRDGKLVTMLSGALHAPDITNLLLANLYVLRKTPDADAG